MNKITKGTLAVAAAAAIALGGAGSLAYWQAQQTTNATFFMTGTLTLDANAGVWKRGDTVIDNPNMAKLIPGDVLTFSRTFTASVTGDGILVTAEASTPTISGPSGETAHPPTVSTPVLSGPDVTPIAGTPYWKVNAAMPARITATYTLTVPAGMEGGMNGFVNLGASTLTLKQVAALPTPSQPAP